MHVEDKHGKVYEINVDPGNNFPDFFGCNSNKLKKNIIMELKTVLHVNGHMTVRPG